jgi:hypothetical protein
MTYVSNQVTTKAPDSARAKSYTWNPRAILALKNNGREQSKIEQVPAKFGKKTFSPITTIPGSSEVVS